MDLYPNIGLDKLGFSVLSHGHWAEEDNRKQFFDQFAKDNEFDPLVASNWYTVTTAMVIPRKGGKSVLEYYGGSFAKALLQLYPDIGLDRTRFMALPNGYWASEQNRKGFFDAFAKEEGFDPLVPGNWYKVALKTVKAKRGFESVMQYYNKRFPSALAQVYPDIGLDESQFAFSAKGTNGTAKVKPHAHENAG